MALKRNLIANYFGQGWTALMGLVFIPLYIKYLGIEAYGLIGLFALLQAWLALLDMGMTPTLNREMARFKAGAHTAESIRDLLRSIEVLAACVAILITAGIWICSEWLATHWLTAEELATSTVSSAFTIMGAVTALRFIENIYRSSIVGLQRQVLLNIMTSTLATFRGLGAVAVLAWVSPTLDAFFLWQGLASLLALVTFAAVTYGALPVARRAASFSLSALHKVVRFAGGMLGIVFLSAVLMQIDKLLLSNLLTLSEYGYYTLAAVAAGALNILSAPITQAWYPRLTELHASSDLGRFVETYHQGAQLVTVVVGSAAIILIVYSELLLRLWTQDTELASRTAHLVSLLALGNLLNGLMRIPYMAQLAYGWTGLAIRINLIAVVAIIPAILWATSWYGAEGAACVWVALNFSYVSIGIQFMYRRILTQEKWRWYTQDILQPLLAAVFAAMLVRFTVPLPTTALGQITVLFFVSGLTLCSAALAAPFARQHLQEKLMMYCSIGKSRHA